MKAKDTNIVIIVLFCFFISCKNTNHSDIKNADSNQITLIFKSPSSDWNQHLKSGGYTPTHCQIEYNDDHFILQQFLPDPTLEFDTLVVKTKRKFIEFRHLYKAFDRLSYVFQNGDTVLFRYQDNIPIASVLNRNTKAYDINFDLYKRESIYLNDYPAYIKYHNPMFLIENSKKLQQEDEKVKNITKELNLEKRLIDSLYRNDLISKDIYNFYLTKSNYQEKVIQLKSLLGLGSLKPKFHILTDEDLRFQPGYDKELGCIHSENILDPKNDSLLYFGFYNEVINCIYYNYFSRIVGRIESTNYINRIATGGGSHPDFLALYDTIKASKILSPLIKNRLELKNIQGIIENNSMDEARLALKKFKNDVHDTALVSFIMKKYKLTDDSLVNTADLQIISTHSERMNFKQLLDKHEENVIYIDFWSSECLPCIKLLDSSEKLKYLYKEQKFKQISISGEQLKSRWITACKKYNLETESYLIENLFSSRQLEKMNIKYLPHYMLYDKKGNLVIESAPRPNEKQLIRLIDKYLAE